MTTDSTTPMSPSRASASDDGYAFVKHLQTLPPIQRDPVSGDWFITRYADVVAMLRDERIGHPSLTKDTVARAKTSDDSSAKRHHPTFHHQFLQIMKLWLTEIDGDRHARIRAAFGTAFQPARVAARTPQLQALADRRVESLPETGEMDLIEQVIAPFSRGVMAETLGVSQEDVQRLERGAQEIAVLMDEGSDPLEKWQGVIGVLRIANYFQRLLAADKSPAAPGLFADLVAIHARGELSAQELVANLVLLFFAGHSTPVAFMANAMHALLSNPQQCAWLRRHPERIRSAVEELLRYDSTAQSVTRVALKPVECGGETIGNWESVRLWLAAANRDSSHFSAPNELKLDREQNSHVTFGLGSHYCLGAPLARLEAQILISTLLRRFPNLALKDSPQEWATTSPLRGLRTLPVTF